MTSLLEKPTTVEQFLHRVTLEYETLSDRLRAVARYVEVNSEHLGLENIRSLAERCRVQPSVIVRFAQHFGFSGFSEMRTLFRESLSLHISASRTNNLRSVQPVRANYAKPAIDDRVDEILTGNVAAIMRLRETLDRRVFVSVVDMLSEAQVIWIVGSRRVFPIAVYLEYMLQHTDKCVGLFSGLGNMHQAEVRSVRRGDVLIVISFTPHADETFQVAQQAKRRGARVIAIADSRMSRVARDAEATLVVRDNAPRDLPGLASAIVFVESLFVALAARLRLPCELT